MNVTAITPGWVEERGVDIPDWGEATSTVEDWKNVQPLSAEEATDMGRQGVTTMLRGVGPPDTVLTAHCRAEIGGVTYEVASVQVWASLTGALAHSEAVFELVEG